MKLSWIWFLALVLATQAKWVNRTTKGSVGVFDSNATFLLGGNAMSLSQYVNDIEGQGRSSPVDTQCAGIVNIAHNYAGVSFIVNATSFQLHAIKDRAGCVSDVYVNGAFSGSLDTLGKGSENTANGICDWANFGLEGLSPGLNNVTIIHQINDNPECWFWAHSIDYTFSVPEWVPSDMKAIIIGVSVGGGVGLLIFIGGLAWCLRRGFSCSSCCGGRGPDPPVPAPVGPPPSPPPSYHSRFTSFVKDATRDNRSMASLRYY